LVESIYGKLSIKIAQGCFLPRFDSFGKAVSEEKII
jgi:hypothetical protein